MEDIFFSAGAPAKRVQDPWYVQWWESIKPFLALPAPKLLSLRDWRLGLGNRIAQLTIVTWKAYTIITAQQFLVSTKPTGQVTAFFESDATFLETQQSFGEMIRNGESNQCADPMQSMYDYEFSREPPVLHNVTGCVSATPDDMVLLKRTELFIPTTTRTTTTYRARADAAAAASQTCDASYFSIPGWSCEDSAGVKVYRPSYKDGYNVYWSPGGLDQQIPDPIEGLAGGGNNGTCVCAKTSYRVFTAAADIVLELEHMYSTSFESGANVRTYVRKWVDSALDPEGDLAMSGTESLRWKKIFEPGQHIKATLGEFLEWMEVDLDKPANEAPNEQWLSGQDRILQGAQGVADGKYPYLRVSGLTVQMQLDYYNYGKAPGLEPPLNSNPEKSGLETVCVLTLRPYLLWTREESMSAINRHPFYAQVIESEVRHGVRFQWAIGGAVSRFSPSLLMNEIIAMLVLMTTVGGAVELFARYGMGDKSNFYRSLMLEQVSVAQEYARFAARMMVAAAFFDTSDTDGSGEMSKIELFESLRKVTVTQSKVSVADTISLGEFIMSLADTGIEDGTEQNPEDDESPKDGHEEEEEEEEESTINREEIVNAFCGPPCSVESLIHIIKRKNRQGRYVMEDEDYEMFERIDKSVAIELGKEKERRDKQKAGLAGSNDNQKEVDLRKLMKLAKKQREDFQKLLEDFEDNTRKLDTLKTRFGSVLPELPDEDAESDAGTENLKNSKTIRKRK
mmetsp:Transcript_48482/g.90288  ORF Transcript_48482/g.90288 Transcript_48482/m.90288 type:complete len:737 (+) Transcript_48482:44-2254(+)